MHDGAVAVVRSPRVRAGVTNEPRRLSADMDLRTHAGRRFSDIYDGLALEFGPGVDPERIREITVLKFELEKAQAAGTLKLEDLVRLTGRYKASGGPRTPEKAQNGPPCAIPGPAKRRGRGMSAAPHVEAKVPPLPTQADKDADLRHYIRRIAEMPVSGGDIAAALADLAGPRAVDLQGRVGGPNERSVFSRPLCTTATGCRQPGLDASPARVAWARLCSRHQRESQARLHARRERSQG
jgi:hypothetical protein